MANIQNFKDLIVWQKAMDLVREIYKITKKFPKTEVYALASQMQRSAVSIPSNIAEGHRRNHRTEYIQFLGIALGSAAELETQVLIAQKEYQEPDYKRAKDLLDEIQKMLYAIIKTLSSVKTQR